MGILGLGYGMGKKRTTYGLAIDWIGTEYHQNVLNGSIRHCEEAGANLVCFVTGRLDPITKAEKCRAELFSKIGNEDLDGIVVCAPALGDLAGTDRAQSLFRSWDGLPIVTLGAKVKPYAGIMNDDKAGMTLMMDHLHREHGYARFAFIQGPALNDESILRWEAVRGYADEHMLRIDPTLVFRGDFTYNSGIAAGKALKPRSGDFDIIVSLNDQMALGAMQVLGDDIKATGFDNSYTARESSLTTIEPFVSCQAALAFSRLEDLIAGRPLKSDGYKAPILIKSKSCGCEPKEAEASDDSRRESLWLDSTLNLGIRIQAAENVADLADSMKEILPAQGLNKWIVVPERKIWNLSGEDMAPHIVHPLCDHVIHPLAPTIPDSWLVEDNAVSLIVEALHEGDEFLGYGFFDISTRRWGFHEWLKNQIAAVFRRWLEDSRPKEEAKAVGRGIDRGKVLEKDWEDMIHRLPLWIIEVDREFRIKFANLAARQLLGNEQSDLIGKNLLNFVEPEQREFLKERMSGLSGGNSIPAQKIDFIDSSGRKVPVLYEPQKVLDTRGCLRYRLSGMNMKPMLRSALIPEDLFFKHYKFTDREKDVMLNMIEGLDIRDISKKLGIGENTVKGYMHNIYIKTGTANKKEFFRVLTDYQNVHLGSTTLFVNLLGRFL